MNSRVSILGGLKVLSVALSLAAAPVSAASPDVALQVSQQLQAQGYRQIEVRRTLLGKVVVTARGHGHLREIVIDPRNGALLRDLVRQENGAQGNVSIAQVGDLQDDDEKDLGEDDGKDDDADDDKDDDGDNSGSGSDDNDDNSGSGSGDDSSDDDGGGDDSDSDGDGGADRDDD